MDITRSARSWRSLGLALATVILSSGIASAASPAGGGDIVAADFRDSSAAAVLAIYPYSDTSSPLSSILVKGPRVEWPADHPTQKSGKVAWIVTISTGPTKAGPWTEVQQSKPWVLTADATGPMERFHNRRISITGDLDAYVKVRTGLRWILTGGGTMMLDTHAYGAYGIVESSGIPPTFGDAISVSRKAVASVLVN